MAKKRSSRTPIVTFIGISKSLTKKQRDKLRSRFGKDVIDVLGPKVEEPMPEVFPIDLNPPPPPVPEESVIDVMSTDVVQESNEVFVREETSRPRGRRKRTPRS